MSNVLVWSALAIVGIVFGVWCIYTAIMDEIAWFYVVGVVSVAIVGGLGLSQATDSYHMYKHRALNQWGYVSNVDSYTGQVSFKDGRVCKYTSAPGRGYYVIQGSCEIHTVNYPPAEPKGSVFR